MKNVKENVNIECKITNDWQQLCDICSSIVKEAGITKEDTQKILTDVRREMNGRNKSCC